MNPTHRAPGATYRLQIHRGFPFSAAEAVVPYLARLGISHLYLSPIFEAPPESNHGYDLWNPNRINSHAGGEAAFEQLLQTARDHHLGIILDIVPNHMGAGPGNPAWVDLLQHGSSSRYYRWFDLGWRDPRILSGDAVVVPILGDAYGSVLARGELSISLGPEGIQLAYFDHRFPLNVEGYCRTLLRLVGSLPPALRAALDPFLGQKNATATVDRSHWIQAVDTLLQAHSDDLRAAAETLAKLGDPPFVHSVHEDQFYRLRHWQHGSDAISYRRFFAINSLPAVRVEDPEVFDQTHALVRRLVAEKKIDGLRIDHIDGLADPETYLQRLQALASCDGTGPLHVVVEKILQETESLPMEWPVHGTTGYEFAAQAGSLLIDPAGEQILTQFYHDFTGIIGGYPQTLEDSKRLVLHRLFEREQAVLADILYRASQISLETRDLTWASIHAALGKFVVALPVYRTYCRPGAVSQADREIIRRTVSAASSGQPDWDRQVMEWIGRILEFAWPGAEEAAAVHAAEFVRKFQQWTGAVMAKGAEDTAFFRYNRLSALNEVGGTPGVFSIDADTFHARNRERLLHHAHSLLATTTHDTKLSEDARMRVAALSQLAPEWEKSVRAAAAMNEPMSTVVAGRRAPDQNEEYLFYQAMLATWPAGGDFAANGTADRLVAYLAKTTNEAKLNSRWSSPNKEWLVAQEKFIRGVLAHPPFLELFRPLARRVAGLGAMNSLALVALKLGSPGVPDFYQGNELWDFSLVDPDNRRPVDYAARSASLDRVESADPEELVRDWESGALKQFVIARLLRFRRDEPLLFAEGDYQPITFTGPGGGQLIGFARRAGDRQLWVVAPIRTATAEPFPGPGYFRGTLARMGTAQGLARDLFTQAEIPVTAEVPVGQLLHRFPLAVLTHLSTP